MQRAALKESPHFYKFQNTPEGINVFFTNRRLDVGFNQSEPQIKNNRTFILSKLNLDLGQLVCAEQVHEDNVCIVTQQDKGKGSVKYQEAIAGTDALITKEKGLVLSILTADCLPIFIIDKKNDTIGLVHAGWRGTKKAIVKNTIFVMQRIFNSDPQNLIIYFGPALRRCCYEVGEEFLSYFQRGVYKKANRVCFDLIEVNYLQLKEIGVLENNIFDAEICTSCQNNRFFSYRREKDACGRQMALIYMG